MARSPCSLAAIIARPARASEMLRRGCGFACFCSLVAGETACLLGIGYVDWPDATGCTRTMENNMCRETVEIYSDQSNAAVLRHPGRSFPGLLLQGDALHALCLRADDVCVQARGALPDDVCRELNRLRNQLQGYLSHYKQVLIEHGLPLPFDDIALPASGTASRSKNE